MQTGRVPAKSLINGLLICLEAVVIPTPDRGYLFHRSVQKQSRVKVGRSKIDLSVLQAALSVNSHPVPETASYKKSH